MLARRNTTALATFAAAVALAACTPGEAEPARTQTESGGAVLSSVVPAAPASADAALQLTVGTGRNEARYLVRERLMGRDLDNDAVGVTGEVSGGIALDSAGRVIPSLSRFVVKTAGLTTDNARRDGYVSRRLLEAAQHPEVVFAATAVRGLPANVATANDATPRTFEVVGDLTVKGVTRPATWQVTARRDGTGVVGTAQTAFTFAAFGLTQPRVPVVLSVADTIRLEYAFTLTPVTRITR